MNGLRVLATGPLATVQDLGRPGFAHLGVPRSGAVDLPALLLANRLVGNAENAAAIEVTLGGLDVRVPRRGLVAVTGPATRVWVDDRETGSHCALAVRAGQRVRIAPPAHGCRNYVAVRGGIAVGAVLGSRATDILSGLGPPVLRPGDELPVGDAVTGWPATHFAPAPGQVDDPGRAVVLHARIGPRHDRLAAVGVLAEGDWSVSPASNRIGVRLDRLPGRGGLRPGYRPGLAEPKSEGVPLGGIQIPPSGQPVLFLADHPVTGGYPVGAVLSATSLAAAGQLTAGDIVRIALTGP